MPFFPPMYGPPPSGQPHQRAAARKPAEIVFGEDWRRDHRGLAEEHRTGAKAYIGAIADRTCDTPEAELYLATQLWARFRDTYDAASPSLDNASAFQLAMREL